MAAAVPQSSNTVTLSGPPTITNTTLTTYNAALVVTFNEAVYSTDGGTGSLVTSDFVFSIAGGTAGLASTEPSSMSEVGNEYTLGLSISGAPNGSEEVTVNPATATSIYSLGGFPAATSQSSNTVTLLNLPTMTITSDEIVSGAITNISPLPLRFRSSEVTSNFEAADITPTNCTISNFTETDDTNSYPTVTAVAEYIPVVIYNKGPDNLTIAFAYLGHATAVKVMSIKNSTDISNLVTLDDDNIYDASPVTITEWNLYDYIVVYFKDRTNANTPKKGSACYIYISNSLSELGLLNKPSSINCYYGGGTLKLRFCDIGDRGDVVDGSYENGFLSQLSGSIWEDGSTYGDLYWYFNDASTTLVTTNFGSSNEIYSSSGTGMFEATDTFIPLYYFNSSEGTLGLVYTADFTATGTGDPVADLEAVVSAGTYTSSATGNSNMLSNTFEWTYDTIPPTMTITSSTVNSGSITNQSPIDVTFTSSEDTTDFESAGVTPFNGSISAFSGGPAVYTALFTPSSQGICSMVVDPDTFKDAAGNFNTVSNTFTFTYDSIDPTMAITSATVNSGEFTGFTTIDVTFTSSEDTINFASGDITVTNGSISAFSGSDATYTATFTSDVAGICTILVAAGKFTDAAGNFNTVSNTFSWTYVTFGPTMTITSHVVISGSSADVKKVILIFTSSLPTIDFTLADISFTGGSLSSFSCVDCNSAGSIYTAVFTFADICTTAAVWVEAGKFSWVDSHHYNTASNTFSWTYAPHCPIAAILPTGVLAPHSANMSQKMVQANKVIYSSSHGGQKHVSNRPYIDPNILPIGKIYYTRYITFYLYIEPLTISTFFSMIPWSNYGNTLAESLELATLFLTMLSNLPRRLTPDHLLPYYATATEVSYLKYVDGSITGGDILLTDTQPYFFIFNNLS